MATPRQRPGPNPPTSAERTALYQTLTNPVRRRILAHIGEHGEANSTSVAKAIGESTGTTSYHLRKLAEQHLIEEIPERSRPAASAGGASSPWNTVRRRPRTGRPGNRRR
jgi:DNA-binding transcriptional ArsR family regulator